MKSKIIRKGDSLLTPKQRESAINDIIYHFESEHDKTIGMIAAEDHLDFILDEIGISIYNKAIDDSKIVLRERIESLEVDMDVLKK